MIEAVSGIAWLVTRNGCVSIAPPIMSGIVDMGKFLLSREGNQSLGLTPTCISDAGNLFPNHANFVAQKHRSITMITPSHSMFGGFVATAILICIRSSVLLNTKRFWQ